MNGLSLQNLTFTSHLLQHEAFPEEHGVWKVVLRAGRTFICSLHLPEEWIDYSKDFADLQKLNLTSRPRDSISG